MIGVESLEELNDGALAAAGRTDQGNSFAWLCCEIQVVSGLSIWPGRVGEGHRLDSECARDVLRLALGLLSNRLLSLVDVNGILSVDKL